MSAAESVSRLMRAFPKEPLPQATFAEYVNDLAAVDEVVLRNAVTVLIRSRREPWFPTIGEIRSVCAEITLGLPSAEEALGQVEARIQWGRDGAETAPAVHPLVAEALRSVGGYPAFKASEDPQATRGRFARVYRDLRAGAVVDAAIGWKPLPALDAPPDVC